MTFEIVLRLATFMERKLSENRHKGDEGGWRRQCTPGFLRRRLTDEVDELLREVKKRTAKPSPEDVWREAADVANFAMMIADRYEQEYSGGSAT